MRVEATLALPELRRILQDRIGELREELNDEDFTFDGQVYQCDKASMMELTFVIASIGAGAKLPAGFVWRTSDNQNIPHTAQTITALAETMLAHRYQIRKKSFELKDAIAVSDRPSQIDIKKPLLAASDARTAITLPTAQR